MELNMDVRPDQLIDIALTVAQVLVAGMLGMIAHSWRTQKQASRENREETPAFAATPTPAPVLTPQQPIEGKHTLQFVSLKSQATPELRGIRDSLVEARRRNRADIIRQARQMIEQGAANRDITQKLRMTDGELALLRQDMNR